VGVAANALDDRLARQVRMVEKREAKALWDVVLSGPLLGIRLDREVGSWHSARRCWTRSDFRAGRRPGCYATTPYNM
jgi:hypothetical protein